MNANNVRINRATHIKIDLVYFLQIFFCKYYTLITYDGIEILSLIVFLNTCGITGLKQNLVHYSLLASICLWGISLITRSVLCVYMLPHYGSVLTIADEKRYNKTTHLYVENFSTVRTYIGVIPRTIVLYFFIPLTNTELCHNIGETNCIMMKIYSVYYLISIGVLAIITLGYFFGLSITMRGIWRYPIIFIRNNLIGLLYGNFANTIEITD
jgi:hypothetical protein